MDQVCLTINDLETLTEFIEAAQKRTGFLKDISIEKVETIMSKKQFPIQVPIDLDGVLDLASNPIVKHVFGKKIETKAIELLIEAANS